MNFWHTNPLAWAQSVNRIRQKSTVELTRVSWSQAMNPQSFPETVEGSFAAQGSPSWAKAVKSYQKSWLAFLRRPTHREVKLVSTSFSLRMRDWTNVLSASLPMEARVAPWVLHSTSADMWSVSLAKSLKHLSFLSRDHPRGHRLTYCSEKYRLIHNWVVRREIDEDLTCLVLIVLLD